MPTVQPKPSRSPGDRAHPGTRKRLVTSRWKVIASKFPGPRASLTQGAEYSGDKMPDVLRISTVEFFGPGTSNKFDESAKTGDSRAARYRGDFQKKGLYAIYTHLTLPIVGIPMFWGKSV